MIWMCHECLDKLEKCEIIDDFKMRIIKETVNEQKQNLNENRNNETNNRKKGEDKKVRIAEIRKKEMMEMDKIEVIEVEVEINREGNQGDTQNRIGSKNDEISRYKHKLIQQKRAKLKNKKIPKCLLQILSTY